MLRHNFRETDKLRGDVPDCAERCVKTVRKLSGDALFVQEVTHLSKIDIFRMVVKILGICAIDPLEYYNY